MIEGDDVLMATELKTIVVQPGTELAEVVEQATEHPILLEKNGQRYRLTREPSDPMAGYDPERTREALRKSRGTLTGIDVEALKADIRAQRGHDCDSDSRSD